MRNLTFFLLLTIFFSFKPEEKSSRQIISLAGYWQFAIDPENAGVREKWFTKDLQDSLALPGTMDENHKGFLNQTPTTMHLNRVYTYEGAAWYRKKIHIPENWKNKHIQLQLERTKSSMVWIDGKLVGNSRLLQSPQLYNLSEYLFPGNHDICIRVDNQLKLTPYGNVHIYSDDTQTNWNGIIGRIYLEASSPTYISNLKVFPDVEKKKIRVKVEIANGAQLKEANFELKVHHINPDSGLHYANKKIKNSVAEEVWLDFDMGSECRLWDEFEPTLYQLTVELSSGSFQDEKSAIFGMRNFSAKGTQFTINGRTTFLRGKHDACVFPLTGYPPMDVDGWLKVFTTAKNYGINHYRFHSWCPPEAAFLAADLSGFYLQAELPFWGGLDVDSIAEMLKTEGFAMLDAYGNHPSFVMFSHGNEIWSGHDRVEKNILAFKSYDSRPLYTMGSNNNIGYVEPRTCSDYFVAARTPYSHDTILTHTRLSQAFADSREGGILNTQTPNTEITFDYAVSHINIPIIGHEIGQYQVFPDYREIQKYTGVLRANNLEIFRDRLKQAGMYDQDMDFHLVSGAWSALCYKAEMEAAIRTKGFGGFQLLDLQDFPGQGTALVGMLDAFMDSKNIVSIKDWKSSCNDVVILAEFPKYCWSNHEIFQAKVMVANYSNKSLYKNLGWEITGTSGEVYGSGSFARLKIPDGGISSTGEIILDLNPVKKPEKVTLHIIIENTTLSNSYPLWIYPVEEEPVDANNIIETNSLSPVILEQLQNGARVLLIPDPADVRKVSVGGLFPPEFWNFGMFKGISEWAKKPVSPGTLGILTNPEHPLFNSFPTDSYTNWQWFSIVKESTPLILDSTSTDYRPVVQVIDNLERNHKLGLIFEFKVGKGKLLVCMAQLYSIMQKPEAAALYHSILRYMQTPEFNPPMNINILSLKKLFPGTH